VHIADVSFFVGEDTALDQEAARRCTTVYLVQKVVPMLPPLLCEQLCRYTHTHLPVCRALFPLPPFPPLLL